MTRRIYRGKTVADGRWVEGYFVCCVNAMSEGYNDRVCVIFDQDTAFYSRVGETDGWEVDGDTVTQSTGLCDVVGKLIYEGDILESRASADEADWKRWTVAYEDGGFSFKSPAMKRGRKRIDAETNLLCSDEIELYGLVVIGNIFDGPFVEVTYEKNDVPR